MAGKKVISLDFEENMPIDENISLVAIHSPLPIFRLAYFINRYLQLKLSREADVDIFYKSSQSMHLKYHYFDDNQQSRYYFIANKAITKQLNKNHQDGFFREEIDYYTYLIPKHKTVDYFLKIEGLDITKELLLKLRKMDQISTAYFVENDTIKSYKNLIFE